LKLKIIIISFIVSVLISCSGDRVENNGKTIFRYNEAAGLVNLDPAFARDQAHIWICNQLYNSLVQLDDSLLIKPSIAKEWVISDDGLLYTFYLNDDIYFHDNEVFNSKKRKVVSSDFAYSFNRLLSEELASPGSWTLSKIDKNQNGEYAIASPNDTTLTIRLKQAFPPFLGILSMQYCSVVPYEAVEYYKDEFGRNPVGTGPFYLQNWVEAIKLVLRKNENYFEYEDGVQLPYLDAIAVSFVIDKMTAFLELVKGNIDFISGLDASYKDELLESNGELKEKYKGSIYLLGEPYLNTEYLGILVDSAFLTDSPMADIKIRKAINYGFDRKKMIKFLRNNIGFAGTAGIIPKGMTAYGGDRDYGYTYDPQKSTDLLKYAGYFNLKEKPEIKIVTTADYLDLCKYVQSQLGEIGLELGVEVSPAAAMREMKANSKLGIFRASWIADYPDPENYLSLFYSKNFAPNGPNYTHYSNSKYDSLYTSAISEVDFNKRNDLYIKMDSLVMEDAPIVVLFYDQSVRFVRKNIRNMTSNPINLLNLKAVKKEN
jgi:ABC-type transport system substrate-binding protein